MSSHNTCDARCGAEGILGADEGEARDGGGVGAVVGHSLGEAAQNQAEEKGREVVAWCGRLAYGVEAGRWEISAESAELAHRSARCLGLAVGGVVEMCAFGRGT